jgi:hypothetical protein
MIRLPLVLVLAATVLAVSAAQAQAVMPPITSTPGLSNSGNIMAHKEKVLAKIQQRMSTLQMLQSCVSAAQDATAMRSCEEQARAASGHTQKKC